MIYNNFAYYRRLNGLTQSDLAAEIGISKNAVSSFENYDYNPSLSVIFKLIDFFGISFDDLFYRE